MITKFLNILTLIIIFAIVSIPATMLVLAKIGWDYKLPFIGQINCNIPIPAFIFFLHMAIVLVVCGIGFAIKELK